MTPCLIFNADEPDAPFGNMAGRSLRKGMFYAQRCSTISALVRTRGNLERFNVICVVNAAGERFKHVILFPGKQLYYRKVRGTIEREHSYLLACDFIRESVVVLTLRSFLIGPRNLSPRQQICSRQGKTCLFCLMAIAAISSIVFFSFSGKTACMLS